ncbi:MAG: phosphate ABC transporter permease subunit PstC, partial [Acidimicrobiia bacterium]|nr:phosphate ABC transporter permease subunit PstC [Acidimicrobiia bacterium]
MATDASTVGDLRATSLRRRPRPLEMLIQGSLFVAAAISIVTTIGIVFELGKEALLFFQLEEVTLGEFFSSTTWQPAILDFGIWPLVLATLMVSVIAMAVALPIGLATAIYLSEYASDRARGILKPILEVLAG